MKTKFCFYDLVFNNKSFDEGCQILVLIRIDFNLLMNNILTLMNY